MRATSAPWQGPAGLIDRKSPGAPAKVSAEQKAELAEIVERGPDVARDGVVRWRRIDHPRHHGLDRDPGAPVLPGHAPVDRSLAIIEKAHGTDDRRVAKWLYNLSRLYLAQGRFEEARNLEAQARAI